MKSQLSLILLMAAVVGCGSPLKQAYMPAGPQTLHPGPGVSGPGPGIVGAAEMGMMGCQAAPERKLQVQFVGPDGMNVAWDITGNGDFGDPALMCPGRENFTENGVYRLKLTNIPLRPGLELFPTLELPAINARTSVFLSHNTVPVQFTDEDFDQVRSGNYVTKVLYLPDPEFQGMAMAGVDTLVSTALQPGDDPIREADRRGSILAIIRIGNINLDANSTASGLGQVGVQPVNPFAAGGSVPAPYISGVTGPEYGAPMTVTPMAGIPGPPALPTGVPAQPTGRTVRSWLPSGGAVAPMVHRAPVVQDCPPMN